MLKNTFILLFASLFVYSCSAPKEKADLIIVNARIYSIDSAFTTFEAMAIKDGKILGLNNSVNILAHFESDQIEDVQGKFIYPGFIDAHCHFTGYATDMWKCNLTGTKSFEEVLEKINLYAQTAPLTWIYGRGWDQNDWLIKEFPNKSELDKLFPDRPVFLKRVDGHAALVNQKGLDLMGITINTKVSGGRIEIQNGKLSGILVDNAMDLVDLKIPLINDSLAKLYYRKAEQDCFANGLTSVHDCGISEHTLELLDQEHKAGHLKLKVFALLSDDSTYYTTWLKKGIYKTERLKMGGFKIYADGALGSRGACLLEAYSDKKEQFGFLLTNIPRMKKIAAQLKQSEFQMCTHAIGDSANRQILKIYAEALGGKNNKRWRIEHAQVINENDFSFFTQYDILPSVQPTHATSDMYWADERLGDERLKNAYAYKKLLTAYGKIALGTDFPVEDISPLETFFAAVARQDAKGYPEKGFQKENALSREEALRGMTIWAAYAAFEEQEKGSLEKGKAADFIILETDLMSSELNAVLNTKVIATYSNGEKVYAMSN